MTIPKRFESVVNGGDAAMVRRVVDRCHVGDSRTKVCRYLVSHLKAGAWAKAPRNARRAYLWLACAAHEENRTLYRTVMYGR